MRSPLHRKQPYEAEYLVISIAFVGCGPTAIYTIYALVRASTESFSLTVFEAQPTLGWGTPYRPGWNDPSMLANIASVELPPLSESLVDWLHRQHDAFLDRFGIDRAKIGERTFYPRLVLGEYFHNQAETILAIARARGIAVKVRPRSRVTDAVAADDGVVLTIKPRSQSAYEDRFDHVVLATGHQWPDNPEIRQGYFVSPWPAAALKGVPACEVGIRGTSLTAIDASLALAVLHGEFVSSEEGTLEYRPFEGTKNFHMTMFSRKGLLPEADFYAPLPYQPLSICTPAAVRDLVSRNVPNLLDAAFELFKRELIAADREYAATTGLAAATLEEFHDRYFERRAALEPFLWAKQNLEEAQSNYKKGIVVAWRYAILRMHEVVEILVPDLEGADYQRFVNYLKPIFVDDYSTVPHKSINRMLALHRAGKLDVIALGDKYHLDTYREEGGAKLEFADQRRTFPVFIEAMGQKTLSANEFPFPSLVHQGIIHDVPTAGTKLRRGIAVDNLFHPISDNIPAGRLFCLSLPFILGRHPFHQGITSSHQMGESVGNELAELVKAEYISFQGAAS